jgi:hypothetical protein
LMCSVYIIAAEKPLSQEFANKDFKYKFHA